MFKVSSIRTAVAFAVVASVLGVTAGSASAETSSKSGWNRCKDGYFCVYQDINGTGKFAMFKVGSADLTKPVGGFRFNDQVSSYWNRTHGTNGKTQKVVMYVDINYRGKTITSTDNKKHGFTDKKSVNWANDQISSIKVNK